MPHPKLAQFASLGWDFDLVMFLKLRGIPPHELKIGGVFYFVFPSSASFRVTRKLQIT